MREKKPAGHKQPTHESQARQGPGCVLPRCPFYLPRESISHTCVCYRNADMSDHSAFHAMYVCPRAEKRRVGGVTIKPASFSPESRLTFVCMRGQGQGWVVLRASKQAESRSQKSWPIAGSRRKRPVWSRLAWICSNPNTAFPCFMQHDRTWEFGRWIFYFSNRHGDSAEGLDLSFPTWLSESRRCYLESSSLAKLSTPTGASSAKRSRSTDERDYWRGLDWNRSRRTT
jgi:hypothetical protein